MSEQKEEQECFKWSVGKLGIALIIYLVDQWLLDGWITLFVTDFLVSEVGVHFGMEPF